MADIDFNEIPKRFFVKVVKTKDIRKVVMPKRGERELYNKVTTKPLFGITEVLPLNELEKNFTYINGKRINAKRIKRGTTFFVVGKRTEFMYAVYIPPKYCVRIPIGQGHRYVNKESKERGTYIVCRVDESKEIDKQRVYTVRPQTFKKIFQIVDRVHNKNGEEIHLTRGVANKYNKEREKIEEIRRKEEGRREQGVGEEGRREQGVGEGKKEVMESNRVQLVIVSRLVRRGKTVGFVLVDYKGKEYYRNKSKIVQLCKSGNVSNAGVRNLNGTEYVYGIGIKLSELPGIEIDTIITER